jgi:signal peptide peptidase SppA
MEDHAQLRYRRIMQAVCETPWAILPSKLAVIVELITLRAEGYKLTDNEIAERIEAARPGSGRPPYATVGGSGGNVAVIPIYGVIMPRATLFSEISGGCSMTGLQQKLQAALNDDAVSAILLDIDSPGGNVALVPETAAVIRNARGQGKPIVAQADTMAASAAYYLASQADEVVVTPSGEVGSIGVIAIHQDVSRALDAAGITTTMITFGENKANGYPYEPLSEDAAQEIQASVDEFGRMFEADVAKGRGVTVSTVHNTFGQGKMFGAQEAVSLGLADRVDTVDATIGRLAHAPSRARVGGRSSAALPSAPDTTGESAAGNLDDRELEAHTELEPVGVEPAASEFAELKASLDAAAGRLRQADDE